MDVAEFHARRRFADTPSGRIAFVEQGEGLPALFIHGVPLNGFHWRHVMKGLGDCRRCIALDLMGLGYTEIAPGQDVSFTAQARMIERIRRCPRPRPGRPGRQRQRRRHLADLRRPQSGAAAQPHADELRRP